MKKTIFDKLDELAKHVTWHVENINNGGCGVFGALVARRLLDLPWSQKCPLEVIGYGVSGTCEMAAKTDAGVVFKRTSIDTLRSKVPNTWDARSWWHAGLVMQHVGLEIKIGEDHFLYDNLGLFERLEHPNFPRLVPGRLSLIEVNQMALHNGRGWCEKFDRAQIPFLTELVDAFLPMPEQKRRRERFRTRTRRISQLRQTVVESAVDTNGQEKPSAAFHAEVIRQREAIVTMAIPV
jgi:hypothetical protein